MTINGSIRTVVNGQTTRATVRIGIGTIAAVAFHKYVEMPEDLHAPATGVVILVVNELSYVGTLLWKFFVKKVEDYTK